jgi:hypothetical protein
LNFDYFKLLDLLTIARSRKHIQRYYDLTEVGPLPEACASPGRQRQRPSRSRL